MFSFYEINPLSQIYSIRISGQLFRLNSSYFYSGNSMETIYCRRITLIFYENVYSYNLYILY